MRKQVLLLLLVSFCRASTCKAQPLTTLYGRLHPQALVEALAFYELYPDTPEGRRALERATSLLKVSSLEQTVALVPLLNRPSYERRPLSIEEITLIESLCRHLPNRQLKGYQASCEQEVLSLSSEEIDLGKALILSQARASGLSSEETVTQARSYSALLDVIALHILAHLPAQASSLEKIQATNQCIFEQMRFRFPPHSLYTENIDLYTFLPSVMDHHLGVCLGVTALYLAIAQRLDLPLEIITPPGHIFLRAPAAPEAGVAPPINIETTARGVHLPDQIYLSLQMPFLQKRSLKEVIGMTHVNQASTYFHRAEYSKAALAYEQARLYLHEDTLVQELLGYTYLLLGNEADAKALLKSVIEKDEKGTYGMASDYLQGSIDLSAIKAILMPVDETREALVAKQKSLSALVERFPRFFTGWQQLAITWIQLGRNKEALVALEHCHEIDSRDLVTEYHLALLYGMRHNFKACWHHLKEAEKLATPQQRALEPLHTLRASLLLHSPE